MSSHFHGMSPIGVALNVIKSNRSNDHVVGDGQCIDKVQRVWVELLAQGVQVETDLFSLQQRQSFVRDKETQVL